MAYRGVGGGALVLIHCLVGCLHSGAALCVLHCGAELPVRSLVRWLALGGVAGGALGLHLCGVGGLHLCLALPVRHSGTHSLKTGFLNSAGNGLHYSVASFNSTTISTSTSYSYSKSPNASCTSSKQWSAPQPLPLHPSQSPPSHPDEQVVPAKAIFGKINTLSRGLVVTGRQVDR